MKLQAVNSALLLVVVALLAYLAVSQPNQQPAPRIFGPTQLHTDIKWCWYAGTDLDGKKVPAGCKTFRLGDRKALVAYP